MSDHSNTPWQVRFRGGFWGRNTGEAGIEVPLGTRFSWADRQWLVPAVYVCPEGLVLDVCLWARAEVLREFIDRWQLTDTHDLTPHQEAQIRAEHPLQCDCHMTLTVNGQVLKSAHGSGVGWIPCVPDGGGREISALMSHYGLDRELGWYAHRLSFPWTDGAQTLGDLSLTLTADLADYPACTITPQVGHRYTIVHPLTGQEYELTVRHMEQRRLTAPDDGVLYPQCFTAVAYELAPFAEKERVCLRDTYEGDRPRKADGSPAAVGLTTVVPIGREDRVHHGVSSLTFAHPREFTWQVVFRERPWASVTVPLCGERSVIWKY